MATLSLTADQSMTDASDSNTEAMQDWKQKRRTNEMESIEQQLTALYEEWEQLA